MTNKTFFSMTTLILLLAPANLAQNPGEATPSEAVRRELVKMAEDDQKFREEMMNLLSRLVSSNREKTEKKLKEATAEREAFESRNRQRLDEIVREYGWPKKSAFGAEASGAAFLIVQNAELEYQKKYFPLIKEAAARNEANSSDMAILEDRIRTRDGKKQIYGTQVRLNRISQVMELYPIEDEENVDPRRAAVGLMPLAQYLKELGVNYVPPKQNQP